LALDREILAQLDAPGLNLDSDGDLVETLQQRGFTGFLHTEKGALSASKDSLDAALHDATELRELLRRRTQISTLVRTFMGPWLEQSAATGRIYPSYNQVRNPDGYGTRTGRMSSSNPNLTNVPNKLQDTLPLMKSYILPEDGHEWTCADFKSQEPRIAAHFEDGALLQAYQNDTELDVYLFVADLAGVLRKQAKTIFLGLVYGMGAQKLADGLGITKDEAAVLRDKVRAAVPGLNDLVASCTKRFRHGLPLTTLGGRVYYCEPPVKGMTFEYKATNVLVQGSAADQSKEALIYAAPRLAALGARIVSFVHDEYSVSHPPEVRDAVYAIIRESAMALPIDVPMLMDIHTGPNWAEAKP
jgi:DNA polymerase-1